MAQEYELSPHLQPAMPSGLAKKQNIRRFTLELFNEGNDHNPLVARPCLRCNGKGFYRTGLGPARRDIKCEKCNGLGGFEDAVPFFENQSAPVLVTPKSSGTVRCPSCGRSFPVTSSQYWTGLRHQCGQKLLLEGPYTSKCWTQKPAVQEGG